MYNPDKDQFRLLANCFLFFRRDLALFIFPKLLADFKDPIQNQNRVATLWAELHIAHVPSILLLSYQHARTKKDLFLYKSSRMYVCLSVCTEASR